MQMIQLRSLLVMGKIGSRQKLLIRWVLAEEPPGFPAVVDQRKLRPFK
jgi:hypothetical protein